jgi:hypothetical protein
MNKDTFNVIACYLWNRRLTTTCPGLARVSILTSGVKVTRAYTCRWILDGGQFIGMEDIGTRLLTCLEATISVDIFGSVIASSGGLRAAHMPEYA